MKHSGSYLIVLYESCTYNTQKRTQNHYVSFAVWYSLKPFYVRMVTAKDIEMCVCKLHLEARTAVNALVSLAVKQNLDMKEIKDYDTFFTFLTTDCKKDDHTYIAWECTQDKKTLCMHIQNRWKTIQQSLAPASDPEITTNLDETFDFYIKSVTSVV